MRRHCKPPRPLLTFLLFLILCGLTYGRLISDGSDIKSDGVTSTKTPRFIRLYASEESCEETYGFMPCTSTALGNLFLILLYGYLMFLAATYLSSGSELLLKIIGPGLIGGLFLPVLGAVPDALLILVSGMSGNKKTAQSQVSVGMGLLAGSTIILLTLIWGTCVIVGKCDIENSVAVDSKDTKRFSLTGSGISTDVWTSYASIVMAISLIPFIIVQFPQIVQTNSGKRLAVLIGLIVSVSLLIAYCLYQAFQPMVQRRRLNYVTHKQVISGILESLKKHSLGRLCTEDGRPDEEVLTKLFNWVDDNKDGKLQRPEVRALILGIRFNDIDLDEEDAVDKVLDDFDVTDDSAIDFDEFKSGIGRWLEMARGGNGQHSSSVDIDSFHQQTKREHDSLGNQSGDGGEDAGGVKNRLSTTIKAVLFLLLGTFIAAAFADPLVDAVNNLSSATSIPSFFISFIALPIATNSSEAVTAIIFSSRKKLRSTSLAFSEIYGAVTMNNVLCLTVFLTIIYVRGLEWDFSSEVLIILIVCLLTGIFASIRTTFPLWTSIIAFLLYPFSLALVYVLDYIFGWT